MSTLTLSSEQIQQILTYAEQTYPVECCGLLMGKINENHDKIVVEIIPAENAWNSETAQAFEEVETTDQPVTSERRFTISPQQMIQAQKQGRDRNLVIIGIYHSHPDHPAIPSEFDRVCAWSDYSYIIISVEKGKATDLQNWSLDEYQQFQVEELIRH
ncbi:Mov34/MPN/PAD-1-like protein [Planktothrix tepida]|uniref:Mov34/MPN/PAD-1-like protein n=2 Tax=Planktothrix TaxID=54304 RepID=A0A1J1LTP9_9CYAN|nr:MULTISPECIES: M67 family metallopeptidase [Planktothrix]CAD5946567.1 Mov34/MPN/PAD-1-like protein [Planktothrix pseudagardhii]CAD5964069.1 Mov34/MPN/PAD-1-like protein [Planktothrix tepida]CUR34929.1 Mov34/MPN/PAD-1-like protein [Planktothrix tepida PCC 9214]